MHYKNTDYDVAIAGGGLAGLIAAIELATAGVRVIVIEKKKYPFHKVCGEYVSNEVLGYLQRLGFDPAGYGASSIHRLRVSTPAGKNVYANLDTGGFGLSRYKMDEALGKLAEQKGATLRTGTKVMDIVFADDCFELQLMGEEPITAKLVIGAYGKRDTLDKKLGRGFINRHTGYMAIKYHARLNYPIDEIGLDNFEGGYCGVVKIEEDRYNICYLYKRDPGKGLKNPQEIEDQVLFKNPVLRELFSEAKFISKEPEAINEICFDHKQAVENHLLMAGDAAGLITPLCGNGMSMAITGGKMVAELTLESAVWKQEHIGLQERVKLEDRYRRLWNEQFRSRLFWGKTIQSFFGQPMVTGLCIRGIASVPFLKKRLIQATHGKPII